MMPKIKVVQASHYVYHDLCSMMFCC